MNMIIYYILYDHTHISCSSMCMFIHTSSRINAKNYIVPYHRLYMRNHTMTDKAKKLLLHKPRILRLLD